MTREILVISGTSAVVSIVLKYGVVLANRHLELDLPPVSIGLALFVVFGVACLRRNRIGPVAARADATLQLKDRLTTYLDFRGRPDIDDGFRRAQTRETVAALAFLDPVRGLRIPPLTYLAPLLFIWMLYLDFFPYSVSFIPPAIQQVLRVTDSRRQNQPRSESVGEKDNAGRPASSGSAAPRPESARGVPPSPPSSTAAGEPTADDATRRAAGAGADDPPLPGAVPGMIGEPARLYSEPISTGLTPIGPDASDPAGAKGRGLAEQPLHGRISFNLIPRDGEADGPGVPGTAPGYGSVKDIEITVDYDKIPPAYRPHVRRYFKVLVRLLQGGNDGT